MKRTLTLLPPLLAVACTTAFADEHGERLGHVLANYASEPAIVEKMAKKKAAADFTDDEMRSVLGLLEQYLDPEGVQTQVRAKPGAFRHLRLHRLQAYFTLLRLFLTHEQIAQVLKADFKQLQADDFTDFLVHPALVEPYAAAALPDKIKKAGKQRKMLLELEGVIVADGYPLPDGKAREIVVSVVSALDGVLPRGPNRPAPVASPTEPGELQSLVLRLRAVGTEPGERRQVAGQLLAALPARLERRLRASIDGGLTYQEQRALDRCIDELVD